MRDAGQTLLQAGVEVDIAFTSVLSRCIRSLWILLETLRCEWVPQKLDARLNERHYGALTGWSKDEAEDAFGADRVQQWRRAYDAEPPSADDVAASYVSIDRRYAGMGCEEIPHGESLRQVVRRVELVWRESMIPQLRRDQCVLIVSHGNALRALIKLLDGVSDDEITKIEIGNGEVLKYELDSSLLPQSKTRLLDLSQSRIAIL